MSSNLHNLYKCTLFPSIYVTIYDVMAALGDCRNGMSCLNSFMFLPCIKYGRSDLMELRPVVDVVPTLRCMLVMYGIGIIAIYTVPCKRKLSTHHWKRTVRKWRKR